MARIAGVDLPGRKHISISLRYLYGIGATTALQICKKADIAPDKKTQDLNEAELRRVREVLEQALSQLKHDAVDADEEIDLDELAEA